MNKKELKILKDWGDKQSCGNKACHVCQSFKWEFEKLMIELKGKEK